MPGWDPSSDDHGLLARIAAMEHALTVPWLANALNCSDKLLYKLVAAKRMPSFHVGSLIRLCPQQTARWLKERGSDLRPHKKGNLPKRNEGASE
jgi:excisionase family DNA binding protein